MALLGDKAQVELFVSPIGDSVNLDTRLMLGLC
jgi:hypothetical protein